ncbi:uncharacterized protein LOC126678274 [Mercurialis annua]|uniref:uncharacterized protein LOC126678274 n=1 Tax=Mercurialis annua TaxID=3986 RepID=UPI00215F6AD4|nr:uncharacterized protein LOC126678274 [Mercurialis annua]
MGKEKIFFGSDETKGKKRPARTVEVDSEILEIVLHYDGEFGEGGYLWGEVCARCFDISQLSLNRLDLWAKKIGVKGLVMYYWRQPELDYHRGIKPLEHDRDVEEMARAALKEGVVDVYVRYLTSDDVHNLVPESGPKLELKEIEEDGPFEPVEDGPVEAVEDAAGVEEGPGDELLLLEWYDTEDEGQVEALEVEIAAAEGPSDVAEGPEEGCSKKQKNK